MIHITFPTFPALYISCHAIFAFNILLHLSLPTSDILSLHFPSFLFSHLPPHTCCCNTSCSPPWPAFPMSFPPPFTLTAAHFLFPFLLQTSYCHISCPTLPLSHMLLLHFQPYTFLFTFPVFRFLLHTCGYISWLKHPASYFLAYTSCFAHELCPKPLPIHYIVYYIGCQPFCSAVRILSERLHSLHSFTTFYPQCNLILSVQLMYTRSSTISHNPMQRTDELEELISYFCFKVYFIHYIKNI